MIEVNLADLVQKRYSTKKFDPTRKLSSDQFTQIKALLRFSPSSVNSQPWHFVIASTDHGKQKIIPATQGIYKANESKVLDASHVIVFCAKTDIDEDYIEQIQKTEMAAGRFANEDAKLLAQKVRQFYVNHHRFDAKDAQHWMEKQVYLNLGTVLLGAAALGIDAVPIEGIDTKALDETLGLRQKGFTSVALVAMGYHHPEDFNAQLPKARFAEDEIFTDLEG